MRQPTKTSNAPKFTTLKSNQKAALLRRSGKKTAVKVLFTVLGIITGILFISGIIGSILVTGYVGAINASLPDAGKLVSRDLEQSTKIFDRNGTLLYTVHGEINREFISLDKIPNHVKWSLLAAEDIDFYEHRGIDVTGMLSAGLTWLQGGDLRGASTITQQLTRNTVLVDLLGQDEAFTRSAERKIKEILASFQIENKLTKDQILELYMNEVPLGGTNYGWQTASRAYFNKNVQDLTLAESAFIAGITQAPSFYVNAMANGNEAVVKKRRDAILELMLKYKDKTSATEEQIKAAIEEPIKLNPGKIDLVAPHFVFYVIEQLEKKYGAEALRTGGLRVKTTLDLETQNIANEELGNSIRNFKTWYGVHNGAVVIINPRNGEILTMIGSVDYNNQADRRVDGNVNVAVMPRQMGSSVKPITYIEAFKAGYNPGSLAPDIPMNFGAYKPENWNRKYEGIMSMRTALNLSRNIPAVYALQMIGGPDTFVNAAEKLGYTTLTERGDYGLSLTLGAGDMRLLEHTNAFSTFANKGIRYDTTAILEITDASGKVVYQHDAKKTEKRVYTEEETFLLNWVMCQMGGREDKSAAGMYNAGGQKFCGKTGTTNGPKDLITMAYYPRLSVGIWTGNNNGDLTFGTRGQGWSENVPIVIARNIMQRLIPKYGKEFYVQPAGVVGGSVCKDTGLSAGSDVKCDKESSVFIRSKLPTADKAHLYFPICTKNGKIPSNEAEARANGLVADKLFLDFALPNRAQQGAYETFMREKRGVTMLKDKPDTAYCEPDAPLPTIAITLPAANATLVRGASFSFRATATVAAPLTITRVTYYLDSTELGQKATTPYNITATIPADAAAGPHTLRAVATDSQGRNVEATIQITVTVPPTPTPTITPTATPTPTPSVTP